MADIHEARAAFEAGLMGGLAPDGSPAPRRSVWTRQEPREAAAGSLGPASSGLFAANGQGEELVAEGQRRGPDASDAASCWPSASN